jgi:hypothetical protein
MKLNIILFLVFLVYREHGGHMLILYIFGALYTLDKFITNKLN